jgi:copper chaperone CopZ
MLIKEVMNKSFMQRRRQEMAEPLIKKRKFAVAAMKDQENVNKVKEYLNKKEGINAVNVDSQKGFVRVEYDLRKINFETIEKSIKELGFSLSQKIKEKFKREMAKFTEQNELDNLTATPSSCCEDPKEIRHK